MTTIGLRHTIDFLSVQPEMWESPTCNEMRRIVEGYIRSQGLLDTFACLFHRATTVTCARDTTGKLRAFSLCEMANIRNEGICASERKSLQATYRSATFVRSDSQRTGLGTSLTEAYIDRFRPAVFCFSTASIAWLRKIQGVLSLRDYSCFPNNGQMVPLTVLQVANEVLRVTGRNDNMPTERLIRQGLYLPHGEDAQFASSRVSIWPPASEDALMLVCLDGREIKIK